MPLRFRVETTKKSGPRIAVVRETTLANGSLKTEQIGSFSARKKPDAILPKLMDDQERHEFNSYLSQLKFNQTHFNAEADQLGRIIIRLDEKARQAIIALAILCDKHHIPFMPEDCMLNSLFKKGLAVEAKLNEKLGTRINLLENLGLTIPSVTPPKEIDQESEALFKKLLKHKTAEEVCKDFTALARKHHKTTNFKPDYFKYYAGLVQSKHEQKPAKWYYGIALELLQQYHIDPFTIISIAKGAEYWGWLQKEKLNYQEAIDGFSNQFNMPKKSQAEIKKGLEVVYYLPRHQKIISSYRFA